MSYLVSFVVHKKDNQYHVAVLDAFGEMNWIIADKQKNTIRIKSLNRLVIKKSDSWDIIQLEGLLQAPVDNVVVVESETVWYILKDRTPLKNIGVDEWLNNNPHFLTKR